MNIFQISIKPSHCPFDPMTHIPSLYRFGWRIRIAKYGPFEKKNRKMKSKTKPHHSRPSDSKLVHRWPISAQPFRHSSMQRRFARKFGPGKTTNMMMQKKAKLLRKAFLRMIANMMPGTIATHPPEAKPAS